MVILSIQLPCRSRSTPEVGPLVSKAEDPTAPLGNLFQGSVTQWKNCFLMFRQHLLCVMVCPFPLVLLLGTDGKSQASSCFHPYFRCSNRTPELELKHFLTKKKNLHATFSSKIFLRVLYPTRKIKTFVLLSFSHGFSDT